MLNLIFHEATLKTCFARSGW